MVLSGAAELTNPSPHRGRAVPARRGRSSDGSPAPPEAPDQHKAANLLRRRAKPPTEVQLGRSGLSLRKHHSPGPCSLRGTDPGLHPAPSCSHCWAGARHSPLPGHQHGTHAGAAGLTSEPQSLGAGSTQCSEGPRVQRTKFGGGTGWLLGPALSSSATACFPSAAKHTKPPTISLLIHLSKNLPFPLDLEIMRQEAVTLAITFITSDVEQATIRNCVCVCARQRGSEFGVFLSKPFSKHRAIHTPLQSNLPRKGMALK